MLNLAPGPSEDFMQSDQKNAALIGMLFIVAAVTAIMGYLLYDPVLGHPNYILNGPTHASHITWGAVFELLTASSVAGTAITLYPRLRQHGPRRALAYVAFRWLEAVLIVVGLMCMLTILTLRQQWEAGNFTDASGLQAVERALVALHDWTFVLGPNFMLGINTLMYSTVLFQAKLVPRPLGALGVFAALSVFCASVLEIFGVIAQVSASGAVLALPVAVFEISLAVYLLRHGWRVPPTASTPSTP